VGIDDLLPALLFVAGSRSFSGGMLKIFPLSKDFLRGEGISFSSRSHASPSRHFLMRLFFLLKLGLTANSLPYWLPLFPEGGIHSSLFFLGILWYVRF